MQATDETITRTAPGEPGGLTRVQVGGAPIGGRDDWWTVDRRLFAGVDEAMDATKPWRWTKALDYVYAEHVLDKLAFADAMAFLVVAGQALKVGGRIRLAASSLEWVLKTHFSFDRADVDTTIADTFRINRAFHSVGHDFLYSAPMLRRLLEEIGYHDIEFHSYGESHDPALRDLERHQDHRIEGGYPSMWIVEGTTTHAAIEISSTFRAYADKAFGQFMRAEP